MVPTELKEDCKDNTDDLISKIANKIKLSDKELNGGEET